MARPRKGDQYRHEPTDETRLLCKELYACGITRARIAQRFGIDQETLSKYYVAELENNKEVMIASLAKNLYRDALEGNESAREFWLKTQGRFAYAKPPEDDGKSTAEALLEKLIDKLPKQS